MKTVITAIVVVLALIIAGYFFYAGMMPWQQQGAPLGVNFYANGTQGISFEYPQTYILTEREVGNAERAHYAITLIHESDAQPRENSEGPPAVAIDIYENTTNQTLEQWLTTSESNRNLGSSALVERTVDGADAVSYHWSGLYEGDTTAFLHNGSIVVVSVTYIAPEDEIRAVYVKILSSLDLVP